MTKHEELAKLGRGQRLNEVTVDYAFLDEVEDVEVDVTRDGEDESDCEGCKI